MIKVYLRYEYSTRKIATLMPGPQIAAIKPVCPSMVEPKTDEALISLPCGMFDDLNNMEF